MVARNWLSQRVSIGGQNSLEIIDGTAHLDVARLLLDHKAHIGRHGFDVEKTGFARKTYSGCSFTR